MEEEEMAEVVGQGFIAVDRQFHPNNDTSFTRINLGMDLELNTIIDELVLGRFDRDGEKAGSADINIKNFGLGNIATEANRPEGFEDLPRVINPQTGQPFQEDELVPFFASDPFIEFAFNETTDDIIGARIGFAGAKGILSGDIQTLSGNIGVDIRDQGEGISNADSDGNLIDQAITLLTPILAGGSPLESQAELVKFNPDNLDDPINGTLDPIRGEFIGVPDGEEFVLSDVSGFTRSALSLISGFSSSEIEIPGCFGFFCGSGDVIVKANNCQVLGIQACFDLGNFESVPVGTIEELNGEKVLADEVPGVFLSFATQPMEWIKDVRQGDINSAEFVPVTKGAFLNLPKGSIQVNLKQALDGIPRYRAEFIDRGVGLF